MNAPSDITHLHEVGVAAQGAPRKAVGGLLARQLPHDHCLVPVVPVRATVSWRMTQHLKPAGASHMRQSRECAATGNRSTTHREEDRMMSLLGSSGVAMLRAFEENALSAHAVRHDRSGCACVSSTIASRWLYQIPGDPAGVALQSTLRASKRTVSSGPKPSQTLQSAHSELSLNVSIEYNHVPIVQSTPKRAPWGKHPMSKCIAHVRGG